MKTALGWVIAFASLTSCSAAYNQGPKFAAAAPPSGYGVVYAYRPAKFYTAAISTWVMCGDRLASLIYSNGYVAFYLPPGKTQCIAAGVPVEFEVTDRGTTYIRLENQMSGMKVDVVSADAGAAEIADCHLAPGGRPRIVGG